MAENQEASTTKAGKNDEEAVAEKRIPVFTVLKNNAILKNIFLVDTPPPSSSSTINQEQQEKEAAVEETLLVGRHPDCNIILEHPSISRFHLRIHSKPSSHSLSVIDLSSVHGTWVSGKKIEPGVRVELNEGDALQLGGSSRMYRLHWVPLSCAYDLENPFVPPPDESGSMEEREEGTHQTQTLDDDSKGLDSLFSDMNIISSSEELIPSAPPMPEDMSSSSYGKGDMEKHTPLRDGFEQSEASEQLLSTQPDKENSSPKTSSAAEESKTVTPVDNPESSSFYGEEDVEKYTLLRDGLDQSEAPELLLCSQPDKENSNPKTPRAAEESKSVTPWDNPESPPVRSVQRSALSIWSRRGKPASVQIQTGRDNKNSTSPNADSDIISVDYDNNDTESISKNLFPSVNVDAEDEEEEKEEIFTPDKENCTPNSLLLRSLKMIGQENMKNKSILKSSASIVDGTDDEIFTPDKENMTPNTLPLKSMKKMGKLEEIKHFNLRRSSPLKNVVGPDVLNDEEHVLISLDSENQTQELLQEQKSTCLTSSNQARSVLQPCAPKGKADRVPFQSLPVDSTSKTKVKAVVLNDSTRSRKPDNLPQFKHINNGTIGEENNRWTMVVDTASLVNKESRKALQLLQGLKGTNLIIPRIVVRELDCMNRRGSFFKRTSEASSALQWIEDCMVNTKWWIHVQSSAEEVRPTAPTPPATPLSCFSEKNDMFSANLIPFSPSGSLLEIISPTAQDHILECALFVRRITNGHLVLLSDDVSLKIKAMAEGLLCETAEQFHDSLANPFSERFLWTDSAPRGPTWSCVDDVVLREKYYHGGPLKKPSKSGEGVKGLKLILLHNSHYRQKTSFQHH